MHTFTVAFKVLRWWVRWGRDRWWVPSRCCCYFVAITITVYNYKIHRVAHYCFCLLCSL